MVRRREENWRVQKVTKRNKNNTRISGGGRFFSLSITMPNFLSFYICRKKQYTKKLVWGITTNLFKIEY